METSKRNDNWVLNTFAFLPLSSKRLFWMLCISSLNVCQAVGTSSCSICVEQIKNKVKYISYCTQSKYQIWGQVWPWKLVFLHSSGWKWAWFTGTDFLVRLWFHFHRPVRVWVDDRTQSVYALSCSCIAQVSSSSPPVCLLSSGVLFAAPEGVAGSCSSTVSHRPLVPVAQAEAHLVLPPSEGLQACPPRCISFTRF